jgi:hypothetical protein
LTLTDIVELTMVEFDSLPATSRSLILTKIALEIVSKNCTNIHQLARKRNQSVHDIWRDVCRKAGQPLCEIPQHVVAPSSGAQAAASLGSMTTAKSFEHSDGVTAVATPSLVKKSSPSSSLGHLAQKRRVMLAIGLGGIVVAAISLFTVVSSMKPQGSLQAIRPAEVVRVGFAKPDSTIQADAAKPSPDSVNLPPLLGTIKRMDAISKTFSKR